MTITQQQLSHVYLVLICGCLICFLSFGMRASMGLFMKPITMYFGWEREVFAFAVALQNLTWGVVAVFCGGIVTRFGNVPLIIAGACIYAVGFVLASVVEHALWMHITVGLLVGSGIAATSFGVVLPAMARMVPAHKRATVLGLGTAAGSFGQFVVILFAQYYLATYGWQEALFDLGLCVLAIILLAFPLSRADAGKGVEETPQKEPIVPVLMRALTHPSYWFVLLGFFVCGFHLAFIIAHMPAFLVDSGFSADTGAWVLAVIGFCNIIGAYGAGVLAERYPNRYVLSAIYALRCVTIVAILFVPMNPVTLFTFAVFTGFLWLATIPPTSNLVAKMFGTKHMALLYGLVFFNHQLGSFFGVWLGGMVFDATGSYDAVWWGALVLAMLTALIHLPVDESRHSRFVAQAI